MFSYRYTLRMSCHMRLQNYPFDKQQCFMRIESCEYYPHAYPQPYPCPHPPWVLPHEVTELPI